MKNEMSARLKGARENLNLSQEYVAKLLNLNRTAIVQIEAGNRKVSAEELGELSRLYGLSSDEILGNNQIEISQSLFARSFEELDDKDKEEIISLMQFKKMMRERKKHE